MLRLRNQIKNIHKSSLDENVWVKKLGAHTSG